MTSAARSYQLDSEFVRAHDQAVDALVSSPRWREENAAMAKLEAIGFGDPGDILRFFRTNDPIAAVDLLRSLSVQAQPTTPHRAPVFRLRRGRWGCRATRRHAVRCSASAGSDGPCRSVRSIDAEPSGMTSTCLLPAPVIRAARLVAARPDAADVALLASVDSNGDFVMRVVPRSRFCSLDPRFSEACAAGKVELVYGDEGASDVDLAVLHVQPRDVREQAAAFIRRNMSLEDAAVCCVRAFGLAPIVAADIMRAVLSPTPSLDDALCAARRAEQDPDPSFGWAVDFEERWARRSRDIMAAVLRQERQAAWLARAA